MTTRRVGGVRVSALWIMLGLVAGTPMATNAQPHAWALDQPFMPHRGRLGVQVQPMSPELREHMGAPSDRGVLVNHVEPDRPAARANLQAGDVIVGAGGTPVRELFDLTRIVARVPRGDPLDLQVIRDKREIVLTAHPDGEAAPWLDPEHWSEWLDKGVHQGTEALRRQLEQLERRLDDLERKLEEQRQQPKGGRAT